MPTKIYLLTDNIDQASKAVQSLKTNGVEESRIGVISSDKNIELTDLPNPDLTETSDVVNALKRGAGTGATTGLVAGLLAMAFPPAGLVIGGAALAGVTGAGAAIGAWSASLIGVSERHPLVKEFGSEIKRGHLLVVADVDQDNDGAIELAERIGANLELASTRYGAIEDAVT